MEEAESVVAAARALRFLRERDDATWPLLFTESAKAIVLNVAAPLALLCETAALGSVQYKALSAYTLVSSATSFASVVFNFLSDGVSAKVSSSVGSHDHLGVRRNVKYSYLFALGLGFLCSVLLISLRKCIFILAGVSKDVEDLSYGFFILRALTVPLIQVTMANTGILSGYQALGLAATLNVIRAAFYIIGVFVALVILKGGLFELGVSGLISYGLAAIIGAACVLFKERPRGAAFEDFVLFSMPKFNGLGGGETRPTVSESLLESPLLSGEGDDDEQAGGRSRPSNTHFWDFFYDGASMLLRSIALQASFFVAAILASRLPDSDEALAAHGIVLQLWMLTSYITDGFANVGTMIGGKYYGSSSWDILDHLLFQRLTERLLICGMMVGALFSILMLLLEDEIISIFTIKQSPKRGLVVAYVKRVWPLLSLMQPINSLVFVYDGLIYACQRFRYVRNVMVLGLAFVYTPVLLAFQGSHSLCESKWGIVAIWSAKAAMNVWRLVALAVHIHLKVGAQSHQ